MNTAQMIFFIYIPLFCLLVSYASSTLMSIEMKYDTRYVRIGKKFTFIDWIIGYISEFILVIFVMFMPILNILVAFYMLFNTEKIKENLWEKRLEKGTYIEKSKYDLVKGYKGKILQMPMEYRKLLIDKYDFNATDTLEVDVYIQLDLRNKY